MVLGNLNLTQRISGIINISKNNSANLDLPKQLFSNNSIKKIQIQGVSKRLLKVHVSISTIFYGARDLKFYMDKLQNYTIWYIR